MPRSPLLDLLPPPTAVQVVQPPEPPRFPLFSELVDEDRRKIVGLRETSELTGVELTEREPAKAPIGMFHSILGGRAEALLDDAMRNPSKYHERVVMVARELYEGRKKFEQLDPEDQRVLHQGAVEFAQYVPPKTTTAPSVRKEPLKKRFRRTRLERPKEPVPGVDIPIGAMRPYWWT